MSNEDRNHLHNPQNVQPRRSRNLTDEDINAILTAIESRFYRNLGKGFWDILWKALVLIAVAIASWGYYHK